MVLILSWKGATSRNWIYRYRKDGKERWLGLGSLRDVSLKNARMARDAARLKVKGDRSAPGIDVVQEKRAARENAKATQTKVNLPIFEECAEIYIREHWSIWSKKHRAQWPSSLKRYAYTTIGRLTISEIKPSHIYELLRPIWVEKRETADRVRGRIEIIIAKNVDVDDADFRNPAELTKQLREESPKRPKGVVQHHPALPYAEASQFMVDLSTAGGIAASYASLSNLHGMPDKRSCGRPLVRDRYVFINLEDPWRTHENATGPRRAAFRACARNSGKDARRRPRRFDLPESRWWNFFRECDAGRTGPYRLWPRHSAWIAPDVCNLGGGVHGLSRRRPGSSAGTQVQVRDYRSLPARAKAREAPCAHERLGAIPGGIKRDLLSRSWLIYLGQLSLRSAQP